MKAHFLAMGVASAIFGASFAWSADIPRPLEGNPGNVFLSGQPVSVAVPVAEDGKWICLDYEGKEWASGKGPVARLENAPVGYHEIWKIGADGKRTDRTTLAVLAPLKAPVPDHTPIALDTAAAWFFRDGKKPFGLKQAASLSALAGVKWVRDRLSWTETEPERGKFAGETIYDRSADAFSAEGLKVLQVFHDTPPWAGERAKFYPDDLRDVHAYLKAMSARWKGKVDAWEPWNEGDTTNFGGHTGEQMMTYQRAAFHGIRAGNPEAIVCQNVFAEHRRSGVVENFTENLDSRLFGAPSFPFDTFNFHHYVQPGSIPGAYAAMKDAAGDMPVWITESYFHFRQGVKKSDVELSDDQRKLRARFVTTNLVTGLNENPATFFTFVLPHYLEGGVLFGLLNADGSPRADYVALAAAGRILAGAQTMGTLNGEVNAYAFSAEPDGERKIVVAMWSEKGERALPRAAFEKAYDFLGREVSPKTIGKDPVYLVFPATAKLDLTPPAILRPPDREEPSPLVIQPVFGKERLRLGNSSWQMKPGETLDAPLRVYLFGKAAADVSLSVETDAALSGSVSGKSFHLDPLGRWDGTLTLKWSGGKVPAKPMLVKLTATAPGMKPCAVVVRISTLMGGVEPVERKPIAVAKDAANWNPTSSKGDLKFNVTDGELKAVADLKDGDRWVYPWLSLPPPDRPGDGFDGVAFNITPAAGKATYSVIVREPGGAFYITSIPSLPNDGKPHRVVILFNELDWASFSPADANHHLDLPRIEGIAIGGNTKEARMDYAVGDLEWVKFAK